MRESSTPQSSVVSSFLMVEKSNENKSFAEARGASTARYLEKMKNLHLEGLACKRELMETLELQSLPMRT